MTALSSNCAFSTLIGSQDSEAETKGECDLHDHGCE